jgi:hypothetical protein
MDQPSNAKTKFLSVLGSVIVAFIFVRAAAAQNIVGTYCAGCHNEKLKTGGLVLTQFDPMRASANTAIAEKVVRKLRAGMMPPPGMPRPDKATLNAFVTSIEKNLDAAAEAHPEPGRPVLHRLNRTEYGNAIRDLLSLQIDPSQFLPPDDMSHGFDNMSDVLTVSPTLMESYIRAAGKISRQALGDLSIETTTVNYTLPRVVSQTKHVEGAPLGTRGGISVVHHFPVDGEYSFRLTFYFHQMGTSLFGQTQGKTEQIEVSVNGERVALFDVNPLMKQFEDLRTPPIKIKAGPQRVSAAFIQRFSGPVQDEVSPPDQSLVDVNVANIPGLTSLPHLHDLVVAGPYHASSISRTPSRDKVFVCRPENERDEIACAKKIVSSFAHLAYRRPITPSDVDRLLSFFQLGRQSGDFEAGVRTAVQAILANPEFVFRFEAVPPHAAPGSVYRINDLELASRLSFFLWSSIPDERLLTLAQQGNLHKANVLEAEVTRMMADPRSAALSANFANQWLTLQNLKEVLPDPLLFPNFDRNLANSMKRETELLFDSVIREDRDVADLLTADYTFVDERLARHYGMPNVTGSRFRRVGITDENRKGLLGQASILTLTSTANRTSPVHRGKWVMEVLLGTPPPPPPPNVPALKEAADLLKPVSVRERMEEHRSNPACASCHKLMDPIGFSLENFDAVGAWRVNDGLFRVNAGGTLYDGTKLDGPASLRRALTSHTDAFLRTFCENLLAYGLGRVPTDSDMPTVRAIERQAAANGNHFSSFVLGIVRSEPYQMRSVEGPEKGISAELSRPAKNGDSGQ